MQSTANALIADARDDAPAWRDTAMPPDLLGRQVTSVMRELVQKVVSYNPERLSTMTTIDNADVIAQTDYIDMSVSGTIEWLMIDAIDHNTSADADFETPIVIVPIEARHRAKGEYEYLEYPIGYFYDNMTKLEKLYGWGGVEDLRVSGVQLPAVVTQDTLKTTLEYPAAFWRAAKWRLLMRLAKHMKATPQDIQWWAAEYKDAQEDMVNDATDHLTPGVLVRDIGHNTDW